MMNYDVPMSGPFGQFTATIPANSWGSAIAIAESLYEEASPSECLTDLESQSLAWSKLNDNY